MKCDGTRAETRFRLSAKGTSPFKSAGGSVQSTTGKRAVYISLQGLYCSCEPMFCSHVTLTGYPLHSLVSPSLPLPCVTVCHHVSNAVYQLLAFFITVRLSNMAEENRAFSNERNRSLNNFPNHNPGVAISLHCLWKRRWMFQTLRVFLVIPLRS